MFRRLDASQAGAATLRLDFEGTEILARTGDSVAAAMLMAGIEQFRTTPVSGSSRAPYCMMGICFDCLVEIDGVANRQACMIEATDGMRLKRQHGARQAR